MKKIWLLVLVVFVILAAIFFLRPKTSTLPNDQTSTPTVTPKPTDITASFEIVTLGTKRIFTSTMYHNLSTDVYISAADPNQVHVKKEGTTWTDFFATLPMKLSKDCLTTGTGQTFCSNDSQRLKFFINDKEDPSALDKEINEGDKLLVTYE